MSEIYTDLHKASIEFDRFLLPISSTGKKKSSIPCQIIWKGQVAKFFNGKSVWPSVGAAKSALRNKIYMDDFISKCVDVPREHMRKSEYSDRLYIDGIFREQAYQKILQELQANGLLEFRPVKID